MAERYPQFAGRPAPPSGATIYAWQGAIQPLPNGSDLAAVLNDLSNNLPVGFGTRGVVCHLYECRAVHVAPPFEINPAQFSTTFDLTVEWSGPPAHPAVRSRNPEISKVLYADHPHLYGDGRICPVTPWLDEWHWQSDTVADYMDQVVLWLVKHMFWLAAGRGKNWLGDSSPHEPHELLAVVGRNDQCFCGSGKKFKKCGLLTPQQHGLN